MNSLFTKACFWTFWRMQWGEGGGGRKIKKLAVSFQAFLDFLSTRRQIWWGYQSHKKSQALATDPALCKAQTWAEGQPQPRAKSGPPAPKTPPLRRGSSQGPPPRAPGAPPQGAAAASSATSLGPQEQA